MKLRKDRNYLFSSSFFPILTPLSSIAITTHHRSSSSSSSISSFITIVSIIICIISLPSFTQSLSHDPSSLLANQLSSTAAAAEAAASTINDASQQLSTTARGQRFWSSLWSTLSASDSKRVHTFSDSGGGGSSSSSSGSSGSLGSGSSSSSSSGSSSASSLGTGGLNSGSSGSGGGNSGSGGGVSGGSTGGLTTSLMSVIGVAPQTSKNPYPIRTALGNLYYRLQQHKTPIMIIPPLVRILYNYRRPILETLGTAMKGMGSGAGGGGGAGAAAAASNVAASAIAAPSLVGKGAMDAMMGGAASNVIPSFAGGAGGAGFGGFPIWPGIGGAAGGGFGAAAGLPMLNPVFKRKK